MELRKPRFPDLVGRIDYERLRTNCCWKLEKAEKGKNVHLLKAKRISAGVTLCSSSVNIQRKLCHKN